MPFIDDALLWCPENDGRMVDISTCLQDGNANQNQDVTGGSCELNSLDPLCNDASDDIFRQLTESSFELDSFLSDFTAAEVKQEENNNNSLNEGQSTLNSNSQNYLAAQQQHLHQQQQQNANNNNLLMPSTSNSNTANGNTNLQQQQSAAENVLSVLAASVSCGSSMSSHLQNRSYQVTSRYSIANPLLAEKLLSPNISELENLSIGSRTGRPPDIKGKRKSYH